jgi:hypothetical protein
MRKTTRLCCLAVLGAAVALSACDTTPQDTDEISREDATSQGAGETAVPNDQAQPAREATTPAERAAESAKYDGRNPPPAMITDPHPEPVPQ